MPYRISKKDKSPTDMLRRIARDEMAGALREATRDDIAPQVHSLRKSIKKVRGLLRLFHDRMDGAKPAGRALADAAREVSDLREAEVMRNVLTRLSKPGGDPEGAAAAKAMLNALPPPAAGPDHAALGLFADRLAAIRHQAKHWRVDETGWPAYADGLVATYRQGRERMEKARDSGAEEDLHAWRTRTKQHWYQARLFEPIWPEMLAPHIDAFDVLGEMLGDHHDLHVLRAETGSYLDTAQAKALDRLIKTEMARLEDEAFSLGARLYAEAPEALAARWGAWYRLWRD